MKIKSIYIALLGASFAFSSCEKDDLCDGTDNQTPRLHISLYDQYNVENKKTAEYAKWYIVGEETFLEATNVSDLYLPLIPGTTSTQWTIELYDVIGEEKFLTGSETLQFSYSPENIYISKACGFKTNFNAFSYQRLNTPNPWMGGVSLTTNSITDEKNVHVQVFY